MNETEKILVLDRGGMELIYPGEWSAHPEPTGVVVLQDPDKSLRLASQLPMSRGRSRRPIVLPCTTKSRRSECTTAFS